MLDLDEIYIEAANGTLSPHTHYKNIPAPAAPMCDFSLRVMA